MKMVIDSSRSGFQEFLGFGGDICKVKVVMADSLGLDFPYNVQSHEVSTLEAFSSELNNPKGSGQALREFRTQQ